MTGEHAFNEVFLNDVRIPADHLVGPEHGGWELAKVTLGNERVSLSRRGRAVGHGPDRRRPGGSGAGRRWRAGPVHAEPWSRSGWRRRSCGSCACGWSRPSWPVARPGAEASVRKAIADAHGQHVMDLARDLAGSYAMLLGTGPVGGWGPDGADAGVDTWSRGFLFSPALTVGGGTAEVQRNIVAEKVLGLPRPDRLDCAGGRRLQRPGVGEALADALARPGHELLGLVEHPDRRCGRGRGSGS